jgi:DNA-binding NarL/FixJ family response regulator
MKSIKLKDILSKREYEIMELVAKGKSNSEIAKKIYREEVTVKKHLHNSFPKMGVRNRTEASVVFNDQQEN